MTYSPTFGQTGAGNETLGITPQAQVAKVQFVIDSHRVTGDLRYGGPPRRLVDLLNALDGGYATIFDGFLDSPLRPDDEMKHFDVAQVRRDAIIYAIPLSGAPAPGSHDESVRKVPARTCLALPAYDITGYCFHVPDADPASVSMLSGRNFVPVTEAAIRPAFQAETVREDIVVVNLARVLVYAPDSTGA
jgi:hypothetical protein